MYYNYTSFYVMEDGSMITHAVEYSYGMIYTTKKKFKFRSPGLYFDDHGGCLVESDGNVNDFSWNVFNGSYGIK